MANYRPSQNDSAGLLIGLIESVEIVFPERFQKGDRRVYPLADLENCVEVTSRYQQVAAGFIQEFAHLYRAGVVSVPVVVPELGKKDRNLGYTSKQLLFGGNDAQTPTNDRVVLDPLAFVVHPNGNFTLERVDPRQCNVVFNVEAKYR